jgi:K+-transporting ATPase ATPase C chain
MKTFIISIKAVLIFTIITGVLYPLLIFAMGKIAFPNQANGSLITKDGKVIGSNLVGQTFDSTIYFHSRPSAINYQPMPSGASNLGPISLVLKDRIDSLRKAYIEFNGLPANTVVPSDAIFASGSGIDPHISLENANFQIDRIAIARGFNSEKKNKLIELVNKYTETHQLGFLGEVRINVLKLNIELDKL